MVNTKNGEEEEEIYYLSKHTCSLKLLGQIYIFSSILTPNVFVSFIEDIDSYNKSIHDQQQLLLLSKLEFVSKGEKSYQSTYQMLLTEQEGYDNDENNYSGGDDLRNHLKTRLPYAAYDLAYNQFIQSTILLEILSLTSTIYSNNDNMKE